MRLRLCSWWNYLALELLAVSVACTALFCAWYASALESGSALELASVGFTVLCVPRTLALVAAHARSWRQPRLQLCVVRILLMVPIYAVDSLVDLQQQRSSEKTRTSVLADTFRECYEAFVIFNFVLYLVNYFGSERALCALLRSKAPIGHVPPLHWCLPRWRMGSRYLNSCKRGALQYVVLRLLTSVVSCLCSLVDTLAWLPRFEDGNWKSAYPYLALLNSCSQSWAIYCLVMFFRAVRHEIAPLRPIAKFTCVKAVVFLTFWQGVLLSLAAQLQRGRDGWGAAPPFRSGEVKDALLCAEMYAFSIAHALVFPPSDYDGAAVAPAVAASLAAAAAPAGASPPSPPLGFGAACMITPSSSELGLREALYEALVPKDVLAHVQQARWSPGHLGLARSQDGGVSASGSQHGTPGGSAPPSREPSYTNLSAAAQRGEGAPRS